MKKSKKLLSCSLAALTIYGYFSPISYAAETSNTIKEAAITIGKRIAIGVPLTLLIWYAIGNFPQGSDAQSLGQPKMNEFSGICNIGNSCYLSSVLQLLYQIPEIRNGNLDCNYDAYGYLKTMMEKMKNGTSAEDSQELHKTVSSLIGALGFRQNVQQKASCAFDKFSFPKNFINTSELLSSSNSSVSDSLSNSLQSLDLDNVPDHHIVSIGRGNDDGTIDHQHVDAPQEVDTPFGKYELKSVVYHSGLTPNSGHYVACSKDSSGDWYLCNDSTVSLIGNKPMEDGTNYGAYDEFYSTMLLYSKKQ